ncbi:MAG TPA: (deoxy)nucleoside triphosphate pyrophosphohydrolase [Nakamurella sp.]
MPSAHVIPLRATMLFDAPVDRVGRVLGRSDVWTRTARALGVRAQVVGRTGSSFAPLADGEVIRIDGRRAGRFGVAVDLEPDADDDSRLVPPTLVLTDPVGPVGTGRLRLFVADTPAGALVTVDVLLEPGRHRARFLIAWPALRRRVLRAEQTLLGIAALAVDEVTVVVAGAIVHDGRLLAARRTRPAELAGRWELPGGKADPGEREADALVRELREELGVDVEVGSRIGPDVELGDRTVLRCLSARPVDPTTPIEPAEHDQIRWLAADELDDVDWLDADRRLLAHLRSALG